MLNLVPLVRNGVEAVGYRARVLAGHCRQISTSRR